MSTRLRSFETRGPVDPIRNYVVPRTEEMADLAQRIKEGRYIVIFAPRQTGKTTFFRWTRLKTKPIFQFNWILRRIKVYRRWLFTVISTSICARKF